MLKANAILRELDISDSGNGMRVSQKDGPGFAMAISEGLAGNRALLHLDVSDNNLGQLWPDDTIHMDGAMAIMMELP
jgi:hypothetical protein